MLLATAFTHAFAAGALVSLGPDGPRPRRLALAGAVLAVLPDLDVAAFRLGIAYAHPLGHRGFSHSLVFALLAGVVTALVFFRDVGPGSRAWWRVVAVLTACAASHGVLDAFTDAGLGVGFFVPFDSSRYFFPWRPLATSPLGLGAFFSGSAASILANEILWVWLPLSALVLLARGLRPPPEGPG